MARLDQVFEETHFAAVYDHFNPWQACDDFHLGWARRLGGPVLDLGCGTGMLACAIAGEGITVVGAEPAEGMLRVARGRAGGERVGWIKGAAQDLDLAERFAMITMTGHAFQALVDDADALGVLRAAARHLAPAGRFIFESRNPTGRAWETWEGEPERVETAGHGRIEQDYEVAHDEATGLTDLTHIIRFLDRGEEIRGSSRLRFITRNHMARLIAEAGLVAHEWFGDWDAGPLREDSKEMIAVTGLA